MQIVRGRFRPEFVNRIEEIIVLRSLARDDVADITRLLLDRLARRLRSQRIEVEFGDAAVDHLADEGFDLEYGARPLRRTIQREVENELSRMLLAGTLAPGDRVRVDVGDGHGLTFDVETSDAAAEPAPAAGSAR
jgi:ATP-dependent Clp protease ATP-binding subunit ClpC